MMTNLLKLGVFFAFMLPAALMAVEITGAGSMIPVHLMKAWGDAYSQRTPGTTIKYQGSTPAEGIKRLINKEIDFASIDMPLSLEELNKNGLMQFPFVLGAIAPMVNLHNVYIGQLRLDAKVLGDIFLGNIKRWNDPAIVAMNPKVLLPDAEIIVVHRFASPGVKTMIGDLLAKNNAQWKEIKGSSMGGSWPATAIEVKNPKEHFEKIKQNPNSIGYGSIPLAMRHGLPYVKMRNIEGNFVSPSDENVSAAASNAKWDESNGFNVVLTDQPGANTWPMSNTSFILLRKTSERPEHTRELLKFFKYGLRYGGLKAVESDYIPLPDTVAKVVQKSWNNIVDEKGVPVLKD